MRKFGVREVLFDDWRQTASWTAASAACLLSGMALGWSWRDGPGSSESVKILEVMTALGTVGAAVSAVWVAIWQARRYASLEKERIRREAEEITARNRRLARLAASALAPRVKVLEDDADNVAVGLALYSKVNADKVKFSALCKQFQVMDLSIPLEQLLLIESLPNDCADDIASCLARLAKVRAAMFRHEDMMYDRFTTDENRMEMFSRWHHEVYIIVHALRQARTSLSEYSLSALGMMVDDE